MKIIHFNSGLGNQIFQYMFYLYQKDRTKHIYGYYNPKWLKQHNGLEVDKVLSIDLPKATSISDFIVLICRVLHRIDFKGVLFSSDKNYNPSSIYYSGYWQDIKFYKDLPKPRFRQFELGHKNSRIQEMMHKENSVSVHIRRGDYLSPETVANMGNICTLAYYRKAMEIVQSKIDSPVFFVFSDDMNWAKENLIGDNVHFIDWNTGKKSYLDMYLMAQCKAHIIANSSFSYWGAYLSSENFLTIYPSKWYNLQKSPNIAPEDWVAIEAK